jgi:Tol biopolymer transport system component
MIRAGVLALAGALLVAPAVAQATFPGRNGDFAVTQSGCQENQFIRLLPLTGRGSRDVTPRCEAIGEDVFRTTFAPAWAPDGQRMVFVDGSRGGSPTFMTARFDGADPLPASPARQGAGGGLQGPSFSPDGTRLVYERGRKIYTSAVDGTDEQLAYGGPAFYTRPEWSPDGRTFLVERLGARSGIWLLSATTGRPLRRLSRGGFEPDWSPDSRRIVFRSRYQQQEIKGGATGGNLYVVPADGRGRPRQIVHRERVAETSPVWSPDGKSIAWVALNFTAGDVGFRVFPSLWRKYVGTRPVTLQKVRTLPQPSVEEGLYDPPKLAWRPLPD